MVFKQTADMPRGRDVRDTLTQSTGAARLVLGGRFGEQPRDLTYRLLDSFYSAGGRFVETAHSYAGGAAESQLGGWLSTAPDDVICVTKVGHPPEGSDRVPVSSIAGEIRRSAERLHRDTLDLVLLHRDDTQYPVDVLLGPLLSAAEAGHVAVIGAANWTAHRLDLAMEATRAVGGLGAASAQLSLAVPAKPLWPGTLHAGPELRALHKRHSLPLLAWSANARGFFAGRLNAKDTPDQVGRDSFHTTDNLENYRRCRELAVALDTTPSTVALAWTLKSYPYVLPIIGPASLVELREALDAAELSAHLPEFPP